MSRRRITVPGERDYEVVIGREVLSELVPMLTPGVERVAVLHAPTVGPLAGRVETVCREAGLTPTMVELPDAEDAKTLQVLGRCWDALGAAGFTRSDAVVTVGGGATTDVGGFVAAAWLRGVDVVHIPTTTLAMVDAAVGGKTGINTAAGKNLVGAFHPPAGVLVDLDTLSDLPLEEHRAGLAEVVKAGFIHDLDLLDLVRSRPDAVLDPSSDEAAEAIARAVAVKALVVGADLRETAGAPLSREILNYGHTFGHAIERCEDYRWRHGHAISVGMVYVAEVAGILGHLTPSQIDDHRLVLTALGLPITYRGDRWERLSGSMRVDKKARGSTLRLVLLNGIGSPIVVPAPDDDVLLEAYRRVSA
jgi:3-dehydroquinate synthase